MKQVNQPNEVKKLRVWKNVTQKELAIEIKVCLGSIRLIEQGKLPKIQVQLRLSKYFNMNVDKIFPVPGRQPKKHLVIPLHSIAYPILNKTDDIEVISEEVNKPMTYMMNIKVTEKQKKLLEQFAMNQYPGAHDNLCTCKPIHVVQIRQYHYVENSSNIYGDIDSIVYIDQKADEREEYDSVNELIADYYKYNSVKSSIPVVAFKDICNTFFEGFDEDNYYINDYADYISAYGLSNKIEVIEIVKQLYWDDVAYFFTLAEAKRYINYQKHNLGRNPRTYTKSGGYSNCGDYEPFWNLLFKIGNKFLNP